MTSAVAAILMTGQITNDFVFKFQDNIEIFHKN